MKWIRVVKLGLLSLTGWQNKQFFVLNRVRVWRVRRLLPHPPPPLPEDFIRYAWEAVVELLSKHITVAINDNGVLKYTFRWSLSNYFASKTFNKLCGVIIFSSSRMTLLWRRLAASCLLVGNYLNSWRNKLECVSLHKNTKNGLLIQMIYNGGGSKTGYFGCMIRSVSLLRIRKEWIQSAVTRNNFNTYSSCFAT